MKLQDNPSWERVSMRLFPEILPSRKSPPRKICFGLFLLTFVPLDFDNNIIE
jgi:hypothetical protein